MAEPSKRLVEAVMVTAELMGTTFTPVAARVFVSDLSTYPEARVLAALVRCRREVSGRLTLAAVIERIERERPSAQQVSAYLMLGSTPQSSDAAREAIAAINDLLSKQLKRSRRMAR